MANYRTPVFGRGQQVQRQRRGGFNKARLLLALGIAAFSLLSYCRTRTENPVTGETQYVDLSPDQEIALGLQAAPEMAQQHGGLHPDRAAQDQVDLVGGEIVSKSMASQTPYNFEFHLLADPNTVNAFALPGGQVFITAALYNRLESIGQLAGVLGHEVAHVVGRHGAEHMAKAKLTQGLAGAAVLATSDPSQRSAGIAQMIGRMINMKYGRADELESDKFGIWFMSDAGYDPRSMERVMEILAEASQGPRPAEFFSTHPNPEQRVEQIRAEIQRRFPSGVPSTLKP